MTRHGGSGSLLGAALAALLVAAAGCGARSPAGGAASAATTAAVERFTCPPAAAHPIPARGRVGRRGPLRVLTTVAPITSIVANVAGDRAQVTGIIPEGSDSHTYEPKPSAATAMARADVVFVNGLGLEDPTAQLARASLRPGAPVVALGTLTIAPSQEIYDFSFPRAAGKPNPHLWTNPPMARCYATIAAGALAALDPPNAAVYRANASAFGAKVDALDAAMVAATRSMPARSRELLTYHDAYAYFAVHYGWRIIGAIQVSSFEDPTPREVTRLIEQVRAEHVPAIFGSEVFPSTVLGQIAAETGARYVDKLRDDDLPGRPGDPEHSYLGLIRFDFVTMVANLGGDASGLRRVDIGDVHPDRASYPQ